MESSAGLAEVRCEEEVGSGEGVFLVGRVGVGAPDRLEGCLVIFFCSVSHQRSLGPLCDLALSLFFFLLSVPAALSLSSSSTHLSNPCISKLRCHHPLSCLAREESNGRLFESAEARVVHRFEAAAVDKDRTRRLRTPASFPFLIVDP